MTIKYGFNWTKDNWGYLGIHCQNKMYAISSSLNKKGEWTHELLTYQKCSLTGSYSYELPHRKSSEFSTTDINKIVEVINGRVEYWKQQDRPRSKVGYKPVYRSADTNKPVNYYAIAMENRMSKFLGEPNVNYR